MPGGEEATNWNKSLLPNAKSTTKNTTNNQSNIPSTRICPASVSRSTGAVSKNHFSTRRQGFSVSIKHFFTRLQRYSVSKIYFLTRLRCFSVSKNDFFTRRQHFSTQIWSTFTRLQCFSTRMSFWAVLPTIKAGTKMYFNRYIKIKFSLVEPRLT